MLRLDAALYEMVKGGAHVAKHVLGARDRAFGARDAAKVEAEEAELAVVGVELEIRQPVLVLLRVAADEEDKPRRDVL